MLFNCIVGIVGSCIFEARLILGSKSQDILDCLRRIAPYKKFRWLLRFSFSLPENQSTNLTPASNVLLSSECLLPSQTSDQCVMVAAGDLLTTGRITVR